MFYMQFGNWKEWINKFVKNDDNNKEKVEELQEPLTHISSSIELLQPTQEIVRESVSYNNDGTVRLFPTNKNGSYFILGKQNPNNLKNFTTDNNNNKFIKKKEGNIEYWSVFCGDITYKSTGEYAKSCRLNIFASTTKQTNDWKSATKSGFIGNKNDLKNQEVTAIIRVNKRVGRKTACCIKMRGGGHHTNNPDQAACIQLDVSTRDSGHAAARWAKELSHPLYEYQDLTPFFEFYVEEGKWFGIKTISWNNNDSKDNTTTTTTNRCYIDPDPFNSDDGILRNNYRLYSEYVDKGNGNKYPKVVVNWAGGVPTTIRVDGFENVDFYACNASEIIAPSYPLID
jgi:hypothetical protein